MCIAWSLLIWLEGSPLGENTTAETPSQTEI